MEDIKKDFLVNEAAKRIYNLAAEVYSKQIEIKPLLGTIGAFGIAFEQGNRKIINLDSSLIEGKAIDVKEDFGYVLFHELLHHELRHFGRFSEKLKENPTISNLVLDLFINNIVNKIFNSKVNDQVSTFEGLLKDGILTKQDYDKLVESSEDEIFDHFFKDSQISKALQNLQQEIDKLFDQSDQQQNSGNNQNQGSNSDSQQNSGNNQSPNSNSGSDISDIMNQIGQRIQEAVSNASNNSSGKGKKLLDKYGRQIASDYIAKKLQDSMEGEDSSPSKQVSAKDVLKKLAEHLKNKGHGLGDRLLEMIDEKIPISIHKMLRFLEKTPGFSKKKLVYPKKSVFHHSGVILPKRRTEGFIATFIVDSSGSMSNEELQTMLKIAKYILALGNEIILRFHSVESQETRIRNIRDFENLLKNPIISGGSDFTNAFKKDDVGFFYSDLYIDYDLSKMPKSIIIIVPKDHDKNVRQELSKHFLIVDIDRIF
jgi:predicted metal-dependent peptidase